METGSGNAQQSGFEKTIRPVLQMLFFIFVVKPFILFFIGLRVRGAGNLPETDPFILIANHSSHLDTAILLSLFRPSRLRKIRPAAAADYFLRNRGIAWFSRTFFNILPIAREKITPVNNPVEVMAAALDRGESIVLFPEGTRGTGGAPVHFHSGIAHLLEKRPDTPVVPACIINAGRSLPKGEWIPLPLFCEIRIGPPCRPTGKRNAIIAFLETEVEKLREDSDKITP